MQRSLHRRLVEDALADQETDLGAFIEDGKANGKSMEDLAFELRQLTGVSFSTRSLYRWADDMERAS